MKKILVIISLLSCALFLKAQVITWEEFYPARNHHPVMGDPEFLDDYKSPETKNNIKLPFSVDNSTNKFHPFVMNQGANASCQQFAAIGYALSYELNLLRGTPGNDSMNLCNPLFSFNMLHDGNAWNGISMFPSLNIVRDIGQPLLSDFDIFSDTTIVEWMSGYDRWYSAMHNRIRDYYRIDISTYEGQQTLKHWVWNHCGTSQYGGVALFNSNNPWNSVIIPPGYVEEGKHLITAWAGIATHGLSLVGYNDSIAWDYNSDGKITTDIDLNNDGKIDLRDSEYGAFKFINSYGALWGDTGRCYVMYKAMAEKYPYGGIWNNEAIILDINDGYSPELTLRYKIKSTSRDKIRLTAGISIHNGTNQPEYILDLPIFRYQGGSKPLQGLSDPGQEIMEGGLDLTPLLSYIEDPNNVKFYLIINSNDEDMINDGEILELELLDYVQNISVESSDMPKPIKHNIINLYDISYNPNADNPVITTPEVILSVKKTTLQLEADLGTPPYLFFLNNTYLKEYDLVDIPDASGDVLNNPNESLVVLPFSFPFYDSHYDTITVNPAGFIMFGEKYHPWPYCVVPSHAFKQSRMVATMFMPWYNYNSQSKIFTDINEDKASFYWICDASYNNDSFFVKAAITIYPDGKIELFNASDPLPQNAAVVSGISAGDNIRFSFADLSTHTTASYTPLPIPNEISLTSSGLMEISSDTANHIYEIPVIVKDKNNLAGKKTLLFGRGPVISAKIHGGESTIPFAGTTAFIDITAFPFQSNDNMACSISCNSPFINNITGNNLIHFPETGTINYDKFFSFDIDPTTPNNQQIIFNITIDTLVMKIKTEIYSFDVKLLDLKIHDNDDETVIPGETFFFDLLINNIGNIQANNLTIKISSQNPEIEFFQDLFHIESLTNNNYKQLLVPSKINDDTEPGTKISIKVEVFVDDHVFTSKNYTLFAGKEDFIILNLSEETSSADSLFFDIAKLGYIVDYCDSIDQYISKYKSTIICFGDINEIYDFTSTEREILKNYLYDGGNLYAEGHRFWFPNLWSPIHNLFSVEGSREPAYNIEKQLLDTDTLRFNLGQNTLINKIEPLWPAFTKLKTTEEICLTAFCDHPKGKTIASLSLYGYIINDDKQLREKYLNTIMDFFNDDEISASIIVEKNSIPTNETLSLLVNSNRIPESVEWNLDNAIIVEDKNTWLSVKWDNIGIKNISCTLIYPDTSITIQCDSCVTVVDSTFIDERDDNTPFKIYPVPTRDYFHIISNLQTEAKYKLIGLEGNTYKNGKILQTTTVETKNLAGGTYLLIIYTPTEVYSRKIIHLK